jgi:hypothetical protein
MRGLRRKGKPDAEDGATDLPRLSWPVRRDGLDLMVSVIPSRAPAEDSFRPVDVLPAEGDAVAGAEAAAGLISSLTRAADTPSTVAIQGFAKRAPTGRVLTFTLAISLAGIPCPKASDFPEQDVSKCELPCGPALRVFRWTEPRTDPAHPGSPVPMFGSTYLAQTDYGLLALAFATPDVDGAREFAVLFEAIANTCTIQPASSAETVAT